MKTRIIFLVGPTAIGKTEVAVELAKKINAEIISCDSMQIYKGMDIITSKPPAALRKRLTHHLINIVSADREYNVARYRRQALKEIKEIIKKGKVPLVVGGSGLYMSILIDGIFKGQAQNKNLRDVLYRQAQDLGNEYLYNRLKSVDAQAARKIHPRDTKRIVRALEVFETRGEAISKLQGQRKPLTDKYDIKIFCLNMEREKLYKRIEGRIERMFKKGLVKEVKRLLKLTPHLRKGAGLKLSRTAAFAIGIKELKGYFDGLYDLGEARRLMARNSRLYAKRQLTWFRKDRRINWVNIDDGEKPKNIVDRILREL